MRDDWARCTRRNTPVAATAIQQIPCENDRKNSKGNPRLASVNL